MTAPVGGTAATTTAPQFDETKYTQAKELLNSDGQFKLDPQHELVAHDYAALMGSLGKGSQDAIAGRVEPKMTEWIKQHPTADAAAFQKELRGQLQRECTQANQIKQFLQKGMNDIMAKMKEMNADRFSDE